MSNESSVKVIRINKMHKDLMLQMDFAKNYTCRAQDEAQSAHWNQVQVTLYFSVSIVFTDKLLESKSQDVKICKIWD